MCEMALFLAQSGKPEQACFSRQQVELDIVMFDRQSVDHLKIEGEAYQQAMPRLLMPIPIVIALAIAEAVPPAIEGHPGKNHHIDRRRCNDGGTGRLGDAKNAGLHLGPVGDLDKFEGLGVNAGEKHPLPRAASGSKQLGGRNFVPYRRVQGNDVTGHELRQHQKLALGQLTAAQQHLHWKTATLLQHQFTQGFLGHGRDPRKNGQSL